MRVAIIGDYPLDTSKIWGGEQAAFTYLVKELSQIEDLQLHVITLANSKLVNQTHVDENGVTVHFLPPFPRFEMYKMFRTYRGWLNDKLNQIQADLIHSQGAIHHGYVALKSGYPAVITVHGVQREDSKHQRTLYLRLRKWLVSQWIERYNLSHTSHLIAIGRYVTQYFSELLKPHTKIYYIPNAIDNNFFDLENASDGHTVLFAGRVIQRKRVLDLVQAFANVAQQHPAAQLRIAGEYHSEPDYAESVRSFIQNAGLDNRVHLLGSLPEEAVLQEFSRCTILALPSAQETTPMVIAQAMAAGKPVVATPVGGVDEMVSHGKTGYLVDVGDIKGLAASLLDLLNDSALCTQMGQASYKFAVENYRADNVAKRTYDVYRNVLAADRYMSST